MSKQLLSAVFPNHKAIARVSEEMVCDKCKLVFKVKDTLIEMCNNVHFHPLSGVKALIKGANKYYLVSPCCNETHLYGFDPA